MSWEVKCIEAGSRAGASLPRGQAASARNPPPHKAFRVPLLAFEACICILTKTQHNYTIDNDAEG